MEKRKDSFQKYGNGPVFGSRETGTMFDAYIWKQDGRLRMDVSWRPKKRLVVTFSDDGIHWEEPVTALQHDETTGWEDNINRSCVVPRPEGGYFMWYTAQDKENIWRIGVVESDDGIHFRRFLDGPVLVPETDFEKDAVMNPFVMYEDGKYRMWYAAGENFEPNVICYAESPDGIHWEKHPGNPIFRCAPENDYEQNRIGACHILKEDAGYLMFYIGYRDVHTACVCAARSKDGITGWERVPENPLVTPTPGTWDEHSCYKPTVVREEDGTYRLWYNGRRNADEFIGYAWGNIK